MDSILFFTDKRTSLGLVRTLAVILSKDYFVKQISNKIIEVKTTSVIENKMLSAKYDLRIVYETKENQHYSSGFKITNKTHLNI